MSFMVPHHPLDPTSSDLPATMLQRVIPVAVLQAIATRYRRPSSRDRTLVGPIILLLVIARFLYPATELSTVLALLCLSDRIRHGHDRSAHKSSISRARYRWGPRPLAALMRVVCRPLASPATVGAFLFGYRTVAFDASYEDVADTPENDRAFGRYRSQSAPSAYPQIMGMYLVECGTHAVLDACPWPCRTSEHHAVRRLVRSVHAEMLVLWDCGLPSYALARAVCDRGAHFLSRVPANQTFVPVQRLPDGSQIVQWFNAPPSRRSPETPSLRVRLLTYHLDDTPTPIRLVTSLLDPDAAPALALICGYHERWEIELTFDEMDSHQRLLHEPLRSQKPQGVVQEFYGLVLAHYVVRSLVVETAQVHQIDPDRISFARAVRLLPVGVLLGDLLDRAGQESLIAALLTLVAQSPLPHRRQRRAPRVRKRPSPNHRLRTRATAYAIVPLPPFRDRITIAVPDQPAAA